VSRVPITVMGYRCDRCGHEWIPRADFDTEPKHCPKCKSKKWNSAPRSATTYEDFRARVQSAITEAGEPLTWTDIRTRMRLPQLYPNNGWVRRLEKDIGLTREKDRRGIIQWFLPTAESS
jgi:predicted  nucleic acid-binding Zn-ribbon protein